MVVIQQDNLSICEIRLRLSRCEVEAFEFERSQAQAVLSTKLSIWLLSENFAAPGASPLEHTLSEHKTIEWPGEGRQVRTAARTMKMTQGIPVEGGEFLEFHVVVSGGLQ